MLRFLDSASWTANNGNLKYQIDNFAGFGAGLTTGRDQLAYFIFNCGASYTVILGSQNRWRNAFSMQVDTLNPVNGPTEVNIWSWSNGPSTCLATVTLTKTGHLCIRVGGDGQSVLGALAYTSQGVLTPGVWYSIDLDWFFPAIGNGYCSLYINGILDTAIPTVPSANNINWGGVPDRFAWVALNSGAAQTGWALCDIVVADAQGSTNNGLLGPCRVKFYPFTQDQFIQWGLPFPATLPATVNAISEYPGSYPTADHQAPDGDASYIQPTAPDTENLYGIPAVDCYAGILGVALNCCLRDPLGGGIDFVCRPVPSNGLDVDIGSASSPLGYGVVQAITEIDQATGFFPWLDGDIANAWWGVRVVTGTPFVTQLFIEKVTTRSGAPYNCGQLGSYCVPGST